MTMHTRIDEADLPRLAPDAKIALLATVDEAGRPHVSLITSLEAKTPTELMFGQFTEGRSKRHVRRDPRTAFAFLTPDRTLWRGTARWTGCATEGEDYEAYNRKPMFRYNSYFGIHTVHYLDLQENTGPARLPLLGMAAGIAVTALARGGAGTGIDDPVMTAWTERHLARAATLKFLAYVRPDGYPWIVPMVPCVPADRRRLLFSPSVYRDELAGLVEGQPVAVFGATMDAESVLVRGPFGGFSRCRGLKVGTVDVDWIYNSMPPKHGQVYPRPPLEPVREFGSPTAGQEG